MLENCKLKIRKFSSGFTLLELLVVIAIIGILVSLGVVSYTTAQQRGRNAKRIGDLKAIQNSFEQYYLLNKNYSTTCSNMATSISGGLPTDPKTGALYNSGTNCGSGGATSTTYCVCAELEDEVGNATADSSSPTCAFGNGNFYCVSNLQ